MAIYLVILLMATLFRSECISLTEPSHASCPRFFYEQQILKNQMQLEHRMDVKEEKDNLWREEMKRDLDQCRQALDAMKVSVPEKYKELEDKIEAVKTETAVKRLELKQNVDEMGNNVKETYEKIIKTYVNETRRYNGGITPIIVFKAKDVSDKRPSQNARMLFTSVVVNEGKGYDASTGYFTAPVAGLYLFTVQMGEATNKWCQMHIMAGGSLIGTISFRGMSVTTGVSTSGNGMAVLSKGDQVYIKSYTSSTSSDCLYQDSDNWSSFSGVLLNAGV